MGQWAGFTWPRGGLGDSETSLDGLVMSAVATEQADGMGQRDPDEQDRAAAGHGTISRHWGLHVQPVVGVRPWRDTIVPSHLRRDSEEDTELSCARGGCLASRVASCSCELLTDGTCGRSG